MITMCSLQIHCYNKNRDGTEYYKELAETVDENTKIRDEMRKKICDQHLKSAPYED